jgi:multidrug transporter EmrE-like cation transporter
MNARLQDYSYIALTIALSAYGQLILKWRIRDVGPMPEDGLEKIRFLVLQIFDPAIFSSFVAAFLASLAWMAAMTRFDLSHAYPFTSLSFVVVLLLSAWLLNEPFTLQKAVGVALIVMGTAVAARG